MPEKMGISKDNSETKKEVKELDIQEIKNETNSQLNNSLDMDKEKIIKQLKKAALEKGASQEEINNVGKNEARVIKTMNKYVDYKSKKKKKSKEKSDSKKEA